MAAAPTFAATPRCAAASVATANINRDGTGTIATVFTAGSSGSKIEEVRIQATVTTTNGAVRLFLHDGTTYFMLAEQVVTAITVSGSVAGFNAVLTFDNLLLPNGWSLRASTNNAQNFTVAAFGGDF